jgi:hypothetical protein
LKCGKMGDQKGLQINTYSGSKDTLLYIKEYEKPTTLIDMMSKSVEE